MALPAGEDGPLSRRAQKRWAWQLLPQAWALASPLRPHPPTRVGSGVCPRKQAASRTLRRTSGPAQVWTRAQGACALARGTPPGSPAASFLESQHEVWVPTVWRLVLSHLERAGPGTGQPLSSEAGRCAAAMGCGGTVGGSMGRLKRRHGAA